VKVKPGQYAIEMRKKKAGKTMIEVEAERTYYVRVSQTAAGYFFNEDISEISAIQASFQIRDLTLLEETGGHNFDVG